MNEIACQRSPFGGLDKSGDEIPEACQPTGRRERCVTSVFAAIHARRLFLTDAQAALVRGSRVRVGPRVNAAAARSREPLGTRPHQRESWHLACTRPITSTHVRVCVEGVSAERA